MPADPSQQTTTDEFDSIEKVRAGLIELARSLKEQAALFRQSADQREAEADRIIRAVNALEDAHHG